MFKDRSIKVSLVNERRKRSQSNLPITEQSETPNYEAIRDFVKDGVEDLARLGVVVMGAYFAFSSAKEIAVITADRKIRQR